MLGMWKRIYAAVAVLCLSSMLTAQQPVAVTDGTNGNVAVKAARTPPAIADKAHVVTISPNNTGLPVNLPLIVNKAVASIGGATVKTLTDTITATTAGNSLIVSVCAGSVANGSTIVLTLTETGGSDTWTLAATQAQSTTFACSIYYSTNITAGVTAVIATFSGASSANTTIAMETYEVSGLIALSPQVLDTTATGNATSTTPSAGPAQPDSGNEYAFAAFGIGTAAQTVTLGGTGTWVNDSGQVNPASASGLFSFVAASQFRNTDKPLTAAGTITSEPWVLVEAIFSGVSLSIDGVVQIYDGTTNAKVISATNALKTDLSSVAGTATATGNGATSAGSARVTIASDNSNSAGIGGSATGSTVPSAARYVGGNGSGNLTGVTVCDNWTAISQTSGTQIVTGVSAKKTYICSINLVTATAQNIALVGGTGTVCATTTHAIAGGTTAATGWNLPANGGLAQGSGVGVIMQAGTAADNVCILQSASGQISGAISWTQY